MADAGKGDTIMLPHDSAELNGSGTGNGSKIAAYVWSQVSGPSSAIISNPGSPSTMVTGLVQGRYVFQLVVTDDHGLSGVDTTSILVKRWPITTLTLQPTNNPDEISLANIGGVDYTGGTDVTLAAMAWTINGTPGTFRTLIRFDMSSIPAGAIIQSANLYLYSDESGTTGDRVHANYGASNGMLVQRATSNWTAGSITWASQPLGDGPSQIVVPSTTAASLDLNLDVTTQVAAMVNNNANYGFLIKLQNETPLVSRIFTASRDNPNTSHYPKLVIVYK